MQKSTSEMVNHLSNVEPSELDEAIAALNRARQARAELRATVAFKSGDPVEFPWPGVTGCGHLYGYFEMTDAESGKVRIKNVVNHRGKPEYGTIIMDALKVEHSEYLQNLKASGNKG